MNNNELKTEYAKAHAIAHEKTLFLNRRLFNTYNRITTKVLGEKLSGVNLDLGCGDGGFSLVCQENEIKSVGVDYPGTDFEEDRLNFSDESVDFVTMNAVIEHIANPTNILKETNRILKKNGLVFLRTPNWIMDYKEFYNDPTHVKPYTPNSMQRVLQLHGFTPIFLEPGLIEKQWFWWKLSNGIKWHMAKLLPGGTKSILAVGQKNEGLR